MTQGELEKIPLKISSIFSDLEIRIMTDIVRRIKENGFSTASADWQITRLQQLGKSEKEIKQWIRQALKASDAEIEQIFSDDVYEQYYEHRRAYKANGKQQIPFEDNEPLQQLIEATKKQISGEYENLAASMGFAIRGADGKVMYSPLMEYYRSTMDNAVMDIHSGAFDYNTVLKRTISQMAASGLRWIDYDSGHRNRIDVAARRAVMTGFRQVQGLINEQVAAELGTDRYEVTYHVGARPSHQSWQGRVWTMQQLHDVCGLGTVTGLHGANCYHDYNPFPRGSERTYTDEQLRQMIDAENTPKTYAGKEYTTYEALQQQRKMETAMRATRQKIKLLQEGGAPDADVILQKAKYQGQMQAYKDFSQKMKLPEQMKRVYQDGLGRMGSTNVVAKAGDTGIIKSKKMYRKKKTDKIKPMPKKQLKKIVKAFRKNGGIIQMNTDTDGYLEYKKAEAITYDAKTILLRQNPGRAAVFEELIHAAQFRKGMNDGSLRSRIICEIEAQNKLLRNAKAYKLTDAEIRQTRSALKAYEKQLNEMG